MEADEKTREKIVSTGRTVMALALVGPLVSAAFITLWAFSFRAESRPEHFAIWLVVESLVAVGLCVLAWFVGRGLTRSHEWARRVALWACIVLECYIIGGWIVSLVRFWLRDPILAVFGGVVTVIPVAIFAYPVYACTRWLRRPAVVAACLPPEVQAEPTEVLDEEE